MGAVFFHKSKMFLSFCQRCLSIRSPGIKCEIAPGVELVSFGTDKTTPSPSSSWRNERNRETVEAVSRVKVATLE
uniref:Uncharacterized protein n=1 Tax=Trichogramma kaykai TaxID=54128 RepID=A0ABD2X8P6_9HYME